MWHKLTHIFLGIGACLLLAACSSAPEPPEFYTEGKTIAPKKATSRPYQIKGVWYYPQPHFEYQEEGLASYYGGGDIFHGRPTATGEIFDMNEVTAAHKTLPLPCIVIVKNIDNGRELEVKVNDRGPFVEGRIIDLSRRAAQLLGFEDKGITKVEVCTHVPKSLALHGIDPGVAETVMLAEAPPAVVPVALPVVKSAPSAASAAPTIATGIFVDVGRYDNHEKAHTASASLAGFGHGTSPPQPIKTSGAQPYAVRLGPLVSMAHANELLDQLSNAGHIMSRIVILR